ncbi:MAG: transposase family protein, partial [Epsilonproteobacteria bacterium]|nr:transposase family protein [Campylobacterota bacterium]
MGLQILCGVYYKTYMTQEFLGWLLNLDQSNVSRLINKILPLIELAADPEFA